MEFRLAKKEDLKQLKIMWKLCFGDTDQFIDFYFQNRDWAAEVAVLAVDDELVSMLTMMPVKMMGENGDTNDASMLYGVATHPDHQKKGYAEKLMEFADQYLLLMGVVVTVLVPAGEELFAFYRKRGYETRFSLREAVLTRSEIDNSAGQNEILQCKMMPAEPEEYNKRRKAALAGQRYIDYYDHDIFFQKQEARLGDTDIFSIEIDGKEGCAVIERMSEDILVVKEILLPDRYLFMALKQLAELFPGEKYIVRTPASLGEVLHGEIRPFGMLQINKAEVSKECSLWMKGMDSYLGIAFD